MPTFPNTGQTTPLSVVFGSCKIEVSEDSGATYTNVGLATSVVANEVQEVTNLQADNGELDFSAYISSHTMEITFNGLEAYMPTWNKIRGGIDLLTQVSTGSTTAIDSYSTGGSSADQFIALQNQGTGSTGITISSVVQLDTAGAGTTLTVDDDYMRMDYLDVVGVVMRNDTGSVYQSTESLVVSYGYDKVASNRLSSGGLSTIEPKWYRLTNNQIVNGSNKYRRIFVYTASLNAGLNMAFKSSNDANPMLEVPFSILGKLDTTRTEGDQLFLIEDEVGGL